MYEGTFKVGDWVRHKYGFIDKIEQVRDGGYVLSFYVGDSILPCFFSESELELWLPQKGECCWFSNTYDNPFIGVFVNRDGDNFMYKHTGSGNTYSAYKCEPFLGELPSFLKE